MHIRSARTQGWTWHHSRASQRSRRSSSAAASACSPSQPCCWCRCRCHRCCHCCCCCCRCCCCCCCAGSACLTPSSWPPALIACCSPSGRAAASPFAAGFTHAVKHASRPSHPGSSGSNSRSASNSIKSCALGSSCCPAPGSSLQPVLTYCDVNVRPRFPPSEPGSRWTTAAMTFAAPMVLCELGSLPGACDPSEPCGCCTESCRACPDGRVAAGLPSALPC